jgi:hypothetical protein
VGRPRELDYAHVRDLKRKGYTIPVIAEILRVHPTTVRHALRHGPGIGPATPAELRKALTDLVEAVEGTPVGGLAAPARKLLERG